MHQFMLPQGRVHPRRIAYADDGMYPSAETLSLFKLPGGTFEIVYEENDGGPVVSQFAHYEDVASAFESFENAKANLGLRRDAGQSEPR